MAFPVHLHRGVAKQFKGSLCCLHSSLRMSWPLAAPSKMWVIRPTASNIRAWCLARVPSRVFALADRQDFMSLSIEGHAVNGVFGAPIFSLHCLRCWLGAADVKLCFKKASVFLEVLKSLTPVVF